MKYEIEYTTSPSHKDIDFLSDRLNQESDNRPFLSSFSFFIRNEDQGIKAGLNGFLMYGAVYTDQLWVDSLYRRQGLGRQLIESVHTLGRKEGCTMATVATMSFLDAEKFYEKMGYTVEFRRPGYVNKADRIYLIRIL